MRNYILNLKQIFQLCTKLRMSCYYIHVYLDFVTRAFPESNLTDLA